MKKTNEIIPKIPRLFESTRPKEQIHNQVARVLPLCVASADNALKPLIPTLENLSDFDRPSNKSPSLASFSATVTYWLLKSQESPIAGSIVLLGGRIRKGENVPEAALRELTEEAHLFGVREKHLTSVGARVVEFDTPKWPDTRQPAHVFNEEQIFIAYVPSFITPRTYDPQDWAQGIVPLSPLRLKELFEKEKISINGKSCLLVDSLCQKNNPRRQKRNVSTIPSADEAIKNSFLLASFLYETQIRHRLIERIRASPEINLTGYLYDGKGWENYQRAKQKLDNAINARNFTAQVAQEFLAASTRYLELIEQALSSQGVDLDAAGILSPETIERVKNEGGRILTHVKKRVKLLQILENCLHGLALEEDLKFIEDSGPQMAFLFVQGLLRIHILSPADYALIQQSPEISSIFAGLCEAFGVNPKESKWYENLLTQLKEYREGKYRLMKCRAHENKELGEVIKRKKEALYQNFAKALGVKESSVNHILHKSWDFFAEYLDHYLKYRASPQLVQKLVPLPDGSSYLDLDELILGAFGIGRFDEETQTIKSRTEEERWIDWRTIINAFRVVEAEKLEELYLQPKENDPLHHTFHAFAGEPISISETHDGNKFDRYRLRIRAKKFTVKHGLVQIELDLSQIIPEALVYFGRKSFFSLLRKLIERSSQKGEDIDDFFRRSLILDFDRFWEQLQKRYPFVPLTLWKEEIYEAWTTEIIRQIIQHYEKYLSGAGFSLKITKVKQTLNLFPDSSHLGSAASKGLQAPWKWVKCVLIAQKEDATYKEEQQIFASTEDVKKKKQDDQDFANRRLFESHRAGYFPLTLVLYRVQMAYDEMMQERLRKRGQIYPPVAIFLS